jgi:hypothetical protein
MKTFKNKFTSGLLALTLMTGAVAYPKHEANAAVIIGIGVPGVGSALVGLGMFMFSVTFGVSLGIHPGIIGAICVLDNDLSDNALKNIETGLRTQFNLKDSTIAVIQDSLKQNLANNQVVTNADGSKSIVLNQEQMNDVMALAQFENLSEESVKELQHLLTHVPSDSELNQIREQLKTVQSSN